MQEIDKNQEVTKAMERLFRLNKLRSLGASEPLVEQVQRLLDLSKSRLGERWTEVEQRYPLYAQFLEAGEKRETAWRDRCEGCHHFKGYEWMMEASDNEPERWCGKHNLLQLSKPRPCPDYGEK